MRKEGKTVDEKVIFDDKAFKSIERNSSIFPFHSDTYRFRLVAMMMGRDKRSQMIFFKFNFSLLRERRKKKESLRLA